MSAGIVELVAGKQTDMAARALIALRSGAAISIVVGERPLRFFDLVPTPELLWAIERDLILLSAGVAAIEAAPGEASEAAANRLAAPSSSDEAGNATDGGAI